MYNCAQIKKIGVIKTSRKTSSPKQKKIADIFILLCTYFLNPPALRFNVNSSMNVAIRRDQKKKHNEAHGNCWCFLLLIRNLHLNKYLHIEYVDMTQKLTSLYFMNLIWALLQYIYYNKTAVVYTATIQHSTMSSQGLGNDEILCDTL